MNNRLIFETEVTEGSPIEKVIIQYRWDAPFDEVFDIFHTMALCMGFAEETVKEYFEPFEITDCDKPLKEE